MKKVVLTSGGLDSSTLLYYLAKKCPQDVCALFFDYGQKSAKQERIAVKVIAKKCGVELKEICLRSVFRFSKSPLLRHQKVPIVTVNRLGNKTWYESKRTEVEFRNGVMMAAAFSVSMQVWKKQSLTLYYGAIKTREFFPDCSNDFVQEFDKMAQLCSSGKIHISAPFLEKGKDEVYKLAKELNVPIEQTWSCYDLGDVPCGKCPACLDRKILEGLNC